MNVFFFIHDFSGLYQAAYAVAVDLFYVLGAMDK